MPPKILELTKRQREVYQKTDQRNRTKKRTPPADIPVDGYALGLRVNEIPEVIGRDAYHVNPQISRKIGLDVHDTNLPNWIRDLYAQKG